MRGVIMAGALAISFGLVGTVQAQELEPRAVALKVKVGSYGNTISQTERAEMNALFDQLVLAARASDRLPLVLAKIAEIKAVVDALVAVPVACLGVQVPLMAADLQAVVNAQPEGTTFCFQPGTYRLAGSILAKSRDRFIGQPGTILDGQGTVDRGIWGYGSAVGQRDVVVRGIAFVNFTGTAVVMGWYWTVSQNEMRDNQIGVSGNSYSTLDGNYIHDNRQYGIVGGPGADFLIVNNEVARNNTSRDCGGTCGGDAGGSKIVGSVVGMTGLIWRNNHVHHNVGPGIWSDGNVRGTIYEGNSVHDNTGAGIFDEISWDAKIRNNTLTNNDSDNIGRSCWWGANILIGTSTNAEVSGNTVNASNGSNGICVVASDRPSDQAPFSTGVANAFVHDNTVTMAGTAQSGLVKSVGMNTTNVRFIRNAYQVPDVTRAWWTWPTVVSATWLQWRAIMQDVDGSASVP